MNRNSQDKTDGLASSFFCVWKDFKLLKDEVARQMEQYPFDNASDTDSVSVCVVKTVGFPT